ncbi:hypothetical protein MLD38_018770 [Melastoma candidum]|uniref:Uncharacterized protein n=1 Tax=Melastoma candidum TaxID=119954 RepID=A0ACB9QXZ8_9MYRT|nr:hypothetical protein MLD38_018770 [Melastoma candidum]
MQCREKLQEFLQQPHQQKAPARACGRCHDFWGQVLLLPMRILRTSGYFVGTIKEDITLRVCTIQGAVDFIFGGAQSIYEKCTISVLGEALGEGISGIITAQGRDNPYDASGFVFKDCKVVGSGTALLGRPWRAYARVVFYHTNLTSVVLPIGWDAWHFAGQENRVTFAEYGCYGLGQILRRG